MDTHVKERLTGAIILVGVLVFLVPELLTGPKREPAPAHTSADEPPLRSYTIDLKDDAQGTPTAGPPAPSAVTTPSPQPMGATDLQSPESVEQSEGASDASIADGESTTADASALADTQTAADSAEGSEPPTPRADANASTASSGSASADSRPDTESRAPVAATGQPPLGSRDAKRAQPSPAADPGTKPKAGATPQPAAQANTSVSGESSPASRDSSKPAAGGGWSIQVGSFSSRVNAERLASELKGKGFAATVSEGKGGGKRGKKLFRVRVGPEPDKAAAKAINTRLRAVGRAGSLVAE